MVCIYSRLNFEHFPSTSNGLDNKCTAFMFDFPLPAAIPNGRPAVVPGHINSEVSSRVLNPPGKS